MELLNTFGIEKDSLLTQDKKLLTGVIFHVLESMREETLINSGKLLKKYDIKYEITEDKYPQITFISLYIDEVGGFVPENTKLFIYKNYVYKLQDTSR